MQPTEFRGCNQEPYKFPVLCYVNKSILCTMENKHVGHILTQEWKVPSGSIELGRMPHSPNPEMLIGRVYTEARF